MTLLSPFRSKVAPGSTTAAEPDDAPAVRRLVDDPRRLAERLLDRVRATVHYLAADDADADDLVQLALVEILRSAKSFRGESKLETWADRITVRTSLRWLKRRRSRHQQIQRAAERDPAATASEPERALALRMLRRRLALKLDRLKPDRRAAVVLRHVHGYSVAEISELTGTPLNTVRDRLRVGKQQLRELVTGDPLLRDWAQPDR